MCKDDTGMAAIRFSQNHSFMGLAALRNVQVHNHKDAGDVRDGWVGMTPCGRFGGGKLCLPDLGIQCTFLPGDLVYFRSAVLQHFVRAAIGERASVVFFSHSGVRARSQNARFIRDEEGYKQAV